jgi:flavin-dependent dehydrogenase
MGDEAEEGTSLFRFNTLRRDGGRWAFNTSRAEFDALLLDGAREAGAEVHQPVTVKGAEELSDGRVTLRTDAGTYHGRWLIDASGHATLLGRRLGTRELVRDDRLRNVAYFGHFEGVRRLEGDLEGCVTIVFCQEGWFWIIPLDAERTSVGLVLDPEAARRSGVAAERMLEWAVQRCPLMRGRLAGAVGPRRNAVRSDFSYRCQPYAGPGHFLVGDAALFLDPIFSTGIFLGMSEARRAAELADDVLANRLRPAAARRRYARFVRRLGRTYGRLILRSYDHAFRELLLESRGPLQVERGLNTVLSGHSVPRLPWAAWWRLKLMLGMSEAQRHVRLVPSRPRFSLFRSDGGAEASSPEAWEAWTAYA